MTVLLPTLTIVACMAAAAFFSGIETGLLAINRLRLRHLVKQGIRRAKILKQYLDAPDRLLGTTLAGTNVSIVAVSVIGAGLTAAQHWGPWGQAAESLVATFLLLAFAEYLPKAWFYSKPYERCARFAPLLATAELVLRPIAGSVIWLTRWLIPSPSQSLFAATGSLTKDEVKLLAGQGADAGVLTEQERSMIHRVFELSSKRAKDIMIPRAMMTTVGADMTITEFLAVARRTRYTRMPVFDPAQNKFTGIVNVFAVAPVAHEDGSKRMAGFVRAPLFISETMPVDAILPRLRRARQPMGLVVNEKTEVVGLLTVEDMLKEIVGQF